MKRVFLILSLCFISRTAVSQFALPQNVVITDHVAATELTDVERGVGIAPYRELAWQYRATGGVGLNLGLLTDAPQAVSIFGGIQHYHQYLSAGFITSSSTNFGPPRKTYLEADILYGYALAGDDLGLYGPHAKQLFASASVGLGYVQYDVRYRFGRRNQLPDTLLASNPNTFEWTVGLPVQVQASYAINRFAGIGAMIFGNLNTKHISAGGMVTVQIGYF